MTKELHELKINKKSDEELLDELIVAFRKSNALLDEGYAELLAEYSRFMENKHAAK